ncbi:MAG: hypothetical protein EBS03_03835 [Actinobacteria bacterium]|nr:hypothetical protein [Actinomycetota bacterium]
MFSRYEILDPRVNLSKSTGFTFGVVDGVGVGVGAGVSVGEGAGVGRDEGFGVATGMAFGRQTLFFFSFTHTYVFCFAVAVAPIFLQLDPFLTAAQTPTIGFRNRAPAINKARSFLLTCRE